MRKIFFFFCVLFFIGCGYKPSSVYQKNLLGDSIKPIVEIDVENPRETIFLKDALNDAIYTILGKNICYNNCKTILKVNASSSSITPIDYDQNGLPIIYKTLVVLNVTLIDKKGKTHHYTISGSYDFRISSNSVIDDQTKLNAFKIASIDALNKLFAQITKEGIDNDN